MSAAHTATVVLGAGPAGLAAAHELSRHGRPVTVLEAQSQVGGLSRTVHHQGYKFDLGGHRWFTKNQDLDAWFHRVLSGELVPVERISRIHFGGRYFRYPIEFGELVRELGLGFMADAGSRYLWSALRQCVASKAPVDMRQAYIAQFGSRLFEMFFEQYSEKVWGRPCHELSADWVSQRSKGLSIWSMLRDALGQRKGEVASLIERFHYPAAGYGRLPERLADDVVRQGGTVVLGAKVVSVECHGPGDYALVYECGGQRQTLQANAVLSTVPLGALVRMLSPACPPSVSAAAAALKFRALVTVNLMIRRPRVSDDTWVYVQDKDVLFGRLHEPKNWSAAMVPDAAHTSLVLECFCTRGDGIWTMGDQEIVQRCVQDLEQRLGLLTAADVEGALVVRTPNAYPVYDLAYGDHVAAIRSHLGGLPGLHILGRGGTFRYNNADHSVEMGLLLAQKLLGHAVEHLDVNTEPEYQELVLPQSGQARDRFSFIDPAAAVIRTGAA